MCNSITTTPFASLHSARICNDINTTQNVVGDLHLKNQNKMYLVGLW